MAAPSASWSVSEAQSFIYEYFLAGEGTDEALQSNERKLSLIINTIPSCARASCTRLERPGGDGA